MSRNAKEVALQNFINLGSIMFRAMIGKGNACTGLRDLCVEAGHVGRKQCIRAVWLFKIVCQDLYRLKMAASEKWLWSNQPNPRLVKNLLDSQGLMNLIGEACA